MDVPVSIPRKVVPMIGVTKATANEAAIRKRSDGLSAGSEKILRARSSRSMWSLACLGNPSGLPHSTSWPVLHPQAAALIWTAALTIIGAPLAAYLFRRRTTD